MDIKMREYKMKAMYAAVTIILSLFIPTLSFSQEFTARSLGDYGNVTVMEITGNYDAKNPDGSINAIPRQLIAKEFFRTHEDEYDFLVIFSNFDFKMPEVDVKAFYNGVKNDTQGIGLPLFDNSTLFGSNGKLQGIIDMGNISNIAINPLDSEFENTLSTLSHEQMHRWAAYVKFKDSSGSISTALLGKDGSHWSFLLDSDASVLLGNQWQDNGNGTFTSISVRKYYSPLDLYLMGFYDKSQVPPMLLIENPDIDPVKLPEVGITIDGTPRYITIDDIIAAEGERIPGPSESQKTFKTAFVLITAPGTFTGYELYGIENIRDGWLTRFSVLTDGPGIIEVASTLKEDIPINPGVTLPPATPRTLPPNIEDGVRWLIDNQGIDGSWMDLEQTIERDTAKAVAVLKNFDIAQQNYSMGLQWLIGVYSGNTDYLSRKIEGLKYSGEDVSALLDELLSRQHPDGGWGSNGSYGSNPVDTSLALKVLSVTGYPDQSVISKAIEYLKSKQNADGGWGSDDEGSSIEATANVLSAFNKYGDKYQLEDQISKGIVWLMQRQNPDGGFGNSPSTVYDTAMTVLTLREFDIPTDITNKALNYILNLQSEDGSWYESPHQTALAVNAAWKATIDPDLSIKTSDITFIPSSVNSLPSNIVVNANIWNIGRTDVPQAKVVLYDGEPSLGRKIGEQSLAFPGQASTIVAFSVAITDGNEHRFYILVDPENLVKESNEINNIALNILRPEITYDFEILPSDITVSQNPVDIFRDVKITSKITNKGTMNAYNIQVKYYIDEGGIPFDIATATVDIPANSTITNEITWRTNKAGENLPITVFADPFNTYAELSEENNKAFTSLTVNGSTEPNLTTSYKDMTLTPNPVNGRGSVNISALVKNEGFSPASNINVNFYKGVPGVDGVLLGSQTISTLNIGENSRISIDWTNITESGERIIYVQVDPDNQIREIREDDNDAFTTLKIFSLPDFSISTNSIVFTPSAPKEGDTVSINVTVQNRGEQGVSNVTVSAYEGSILIGSRNIPSISGNSQTVTSFIYDTTSKSGAHQITVIVDPDNTISEQSEDNNTASRTFGVQDANLWLTEKYISPNGDGVKDSTQFFFRLEAPQTVKIVVVSEKGETVRTFSGSEFENTTAGNIKWDGLNDEGMVVDDGQYQIRVVDINNNNILGSLLVIVDNNRSPLTDAVGTKYLLNNNLTCMLPDIWEESWEWFPDESGILLDIPDTQEYPAGLYTMSPDGEDILRIIPRVWDSGNEPIYYDEYSLSQDGERIAFVLNKWRSDGYGVLLSQLWVMDRDGNNLTLYDDTSDLGPYWIIYNLAWSPDGNNLFYMAGSNIKIIKADGTERTQIDNAGYSWVDLVRWSPDSKKVAYVLGANKVRVSDISGNKEDIFVVSDYNYIKYEGFEWLDNNKIVLIEEISYDRYKLWIIDVSGNGEHKELTGDYDFKGEFSISPDRQSIAFSTSLEDTAYLNISEPGGNTYVLHELKSTNPDYIPQINSIVWSPDSSKIAFIESITPGIGIEGIGIMSSDTEQYRFVVADIKTKREESFPLPSSMNLVSWLSDGITVLGYKGYSSYDSSLVAINSEDGETISLDSPVNIPWDKNKVISPLERYITYYKAIDPSSICYGKGWLDLWAISSLLNLTADLRVSKQKSAVILKGIAVDLNFKGYMLEYVDAKNPTQWNLIALPSDVPVINDIFTTWVPPYEGTFYVRLTVWDKAGNVAWDRKRVSWGLSSSITNLYKNVEIFSPNGDGVKDAVELHYRVLEPVHLEFNIYDENNNLITVIPKDYASPVDDFITWDGRDSIGKIVPDGKYKIKIFDYEFFVEVDNTPPDVGINLKGLMQDFDILTGLGTLMIYTELGGHSVDSKLKNWVVEYGEGDNPQEWYEYVSGEDQLAGRDNNGNLILDPVKDAVIRKYAEEKIEFLVGRKLRITAEDFAVNKSSAVTDFLEEALIFNKWDENILLLKPVLPAHFLRPGPHDLGGIETIRLPIARMNVQYESNGQWVDTPPVENPPSGEINLKWDNSNLDQQVGAIRIKAIDITGYEYYSNILYTQSAFGINTCNLTARNSLFENLEILKLQVQSGQDVRYSQWADYKVYEEDAVPIGVFDLPLPPIESGLKYRFRMIGIGINGKEYIGESRPEVYPPDPRDCKEFINIKFSLSVNYKEADCGLLSDGKATLSAKIEDLDGNVSLKTLSYYIQKPEGLQLLRQFDLIREGWGSVTVDTSNMLEGSYPVKAVLTYLDLNDNTSKEASATNTLIVDRILPTAQITYPGKNLILCPVKVSDPKGDWYGIPVEGIAWDNNNVNRYELYYGIGDNPLQWMPATTRNSKGESIHITRNGPIKGRLGLWNITNLKGTTFSLKLKVVDVAGNVSCYTTSFSVDNLVEITNLVTDKSLFSPNGDGILDDMNISYQIDEYATVDVKIFKLLKTTDGSYVLDSMPVRTIVSGLQHLSGSENTSWDGKGDSGMAVPDGKYGIAVFAKDSCGNTNMRWLYTEVDNTPPIAIINYPRPPDILGNIVEVKGTADDLHFLNYTLEAGQGDNPDTWVLISSNTTPVKENILGKWNTFGLEGKWTSRLAAIDTVGNKNITTVTIDLGARKNLIKDLDATPKLFSPNSDGKLDVARFNYELTDACDVKFEISDLGGTVKKTYTTTTSSAGTYTYTYDGKDNTGAIVPDGAYTIKLTATLSSNTSVTQNETITVIVDVTPPTVDIKQPLENSFIKTDVTVNGTISDNNLLEYSITYTGDSGTVLLNQANQNREDYTFGIIAELPEGNYSIKATARDVGENKTEKNIAFTIDRTPPKVTLDTPKEGEYYGSEKNAINITGTIVERNLETYTLRYGLGDNPSALGGWTDLLSGNIVPTNPQLFSWKVGKNDGIPDALYTLSLYARDKVGSEAEVKVKVKIDNTPPEIAITSPKDGGYVRASIDINGTASDSNLDKYTLEISEGICSSAFKWSTIKTSNTSVKDGLLTTWQTLPPDGDYCMRLTATDKVGNKAEAKVNVKVDTHPPAAPLLSGKIEDKSNARLNWTQNIEPDLNGYNVYRDNQKINTALLKDITHLDQNLKEGIYTYAVTAVDLAGNESTQSNEVKLKVDLKWPDVRIRSPQDGSKVSGLVDIKGTAFGADDFKQYRVYIGQGSNPSTWNLIKTSPVPIPYGPLAQWDTIGLSEGLYSIKLEAEDITGNINSNQIVVTVDNTPPAVPVLISAIPDGSDVTLSWQANVEPDLAGYLLYRNDQLANVSGIVIGDLKPYLIAGTTYLDKALPDGKFRYYLIAMDKAGNMSEQSNTLEVNIDTHPPKATIVEPLDRSRFENKALIKAESPDIDIASIQFQYKNVQETQWINLSNPVTQTPYITYIDPIGLGLTYGDYHLRAVATDNGGKIDPSPLYITVTYTDLTAPDTPLDLKALTNGKDVTLTWKANTEADLDGYNIYRTSGNSKTKVNTSIVKEATYQDKNLSDGVYNYEVTAVDTYGNESKPSNSASAKVYAPIIAQPYTPTGQKVIPINGINAEANSTVDIYVEAVSGSVFQVTTSSDSNGNFTFNAELSLGENRITARSTDIAGNISRASDMVVVVYNEPPSAPTGLMTSVENYNVNLTWNPNAESDLSGYNLYRDVEKVNAPVAITSGNTTASSSYYYNPPSMAFDGDPSTYWMPSYSYGTFNPVWWEIDLLAPELINHVEIHWGSELYAGKDYEIQVWSGYAWITQTKVTGNNIKDNIFDFRPSYRTDRIRIFITDTTAPDYSKQVMISEVKILKDNLITQTSYEDMNLNDSEYNYKLTAVDYYGFESSPSDETKTIVGDVIPPSAPMNLTATASGSDIILNWSANIEADLAGYNIYRNTAQGWLKINTSLIIETTYTNANLPNGTYTYMVTAVDTVGNESTLSNEASASIYIADTISPSRPEIFYPTISEIPVVLYKDKTDVSDNAEPASTVELFKDGVSVGKATALESDVIQSFSVDYSGDGASISPDGNALAYAYNGSIWLKNLVTVNTTQIIQEGESPLWSPDGRRIAYTFMDDNWNDRIGIYDIETGSSTPLTDDIYVYENSPSWSSDGNKIAFTSNRGGSQDVWIKDIISGILTQITNNIYASNPRLSPDGKRLAYSEYQNLYVVDLLSGDAFQVDTQADGYYFDWAPDGRGLAFVSYRNGNADIYVFDINNQNQTQITDSTSDEFNPLWSPDGQSILFMIQEPDWSKSIWITSSDTQGQDRLIQQNLYGLSHLSWAKSGGIAYIDQNKLTIVYLEGYFSFKDIQLDAGENIFYAIAIDSSGNVSPPSEEISVVFDTSLMPDLETTTDDIFIYPPYPITGEEVAIDVVVWNKGQVEVRDVDVDIYLWDLSGNLELLKSEKIPYIAADSGEVIPISWDSTGKADTNTVIVVIDPEDKVPEVFETNNYAEKEFYVADTEGIAMDTILDSNEYKSNQNVNININLRNSGPERDVVMEVWIEDGNGYAVTLLNTIRTRLSYASEQNYNLAWNTVSTYAGSYRVHTLFKNPPDVLTENITPFTILPDIDIESTLVTDETNYGSNEDVFVNFNVRNNGRNYVIPELNLKVRIVDGVDKGLFTEDRNITNLLPGVTTALSSIWNTGLNLPGNYRVILEIYLDSVMVSSRSASFKIDEAIIITGNITVTPSVVILGNTVRASYTIQNIGNADAIGLTVKVSVIDPETQNLMDIKEETIDLGINTMRNGQFVFATQGYELKTYTVKLQYTYQGDQRNIASKSLTVKDGTPPVVSIISPVSGSQFSSDVEIAALVLDDASGVDKVEYQMDDGQWNLLPISDISRGIYKTTWTPTVSDVGVHIISFRASDKAGNTSSPVSTTITIDLMPPVANAGPDQNVITGGVVTLNGSESYDPEGAMITFLWSFIGVPEGSTVTDASLSDVTSVKPTFIPDVDGTYRLKLIVNDGVLNSAPDEVEIIATTPNVAPNANAGPDQNVTTGSTVFLDGNRSNDPDNGPQPLSYFWSFDLIPSGSLLTNDNISGRNQANVSFVPDVDGSYIIRLTVSDGDLTSNDDAVIISTTPNVPPNANAGADITISLCDTAILDGSASNDPDNGLEPLSYSWRFVAVPTGSQLNNDSISSSDTVSPSFKPDVVGIYVLELMVNDGIDVAFDNVAVTVARVRGDLDGDCDVDRNDIHIILAAKNQPASSPDDPRDIDGDGMITTCDARKLVKMCTRPRCATQ